MINIHVLRQNVYKHHKNKLEVLLDAGVPL
jgi:hypothetical protein